MAVSLFSLKKTPASKFPSFIDPTKFGGAASGAKSVMRSETASKAIAVKEVKELSYIRRALQTLVSLEKRHYDMVTDSIKAFALSEQKRQAREEEALQEDKKNKTPGKDDTKNPLLKEGKKRLEGIGSFFQGLMKLFIGYKILEWAGKPENGKKIQNIINFFSRLIKFIGVIGKGIAFAFGLTPIGIVLNNLPKAFDLVIKVVGAIADFISFKWLGESIQAVGKLITDSINVLKSIPNAIGSMVSFITNLIPNFIESVLTQGLNGSKDQLEAEVNKTDTKPAKAETTPGGGEESKPQGIDFGKMFGDSLKNVASTVLQNVIPGGNLIASVGQGISGIFGKKEEELPKLAKGGIVTKPTQAIVGEAGPEAILPLDKLGSFGVDGFKGQVDKQIPKFIKLLTLPFKIVGAGIVALISFSLSKIPGLGPILMPLISNVASMFGIPPSLVKGMSNFASTAIKSVGDKLSGMKELFGVEEPKVTKTKSDEFKPSGDTSVRGLLGDILSALISKNSGSPNTISSPGSGPGSSESPSGSDAPAGSTSPGSAPASSAKDFSKSALEDINLTTTEGRSSREVVDFGTKGLEKVTGQNPGKYYYDAYGNIYAVDKDEKRVLTKADFKKGVAGGPLGAIYFFRNLKNGRVALESHSNASAEGWYDYAANAVREVKEGDGTKNNPSRITWLPISQSKKFKDQFSKETPYGKSTIKAQNGMYINGTGTGDRYPALLENGEYVLNKNLVKAAGGPKTLDKLNFGMFPRFASGGGVSVTSNGPGGNKQLRPGSTFGFKDLNPHHSDEGTTRSYGGMTTGVPKDYGMGILPNYMPSGPNGKVPLPVPGKVLLKEWNKSSGYGRTVIVETSLGKMQFSHLSKFGAFKEGDQLSAGTVIGIQGGSGNRGERDYAEHLHLNATKRGHEAFVNFITSGKPTTGSVDDTDSPGNENQGNNQNQQEPPATWESIAPALADLAKLLTGAPSAPAAPELPAAQPAKITGAVPARSQQLQAAQRESSNIQAQRRSVTQGGANVINVPTPNRTISETATRPMGNPLGGTTPPIPLAVYPVAQ